MNTCPHCGKPLDGEFSLTAPDAQGKRKAAPVVSHGRSVFNLPLNDGTFHDVTDVDIKRYIELYPGIDVDRELRKMLGWLESNPRKRKTKAGVKNFITSWLSKAQDRGGIYGSNGTNSFEAEREQIRRVVREGR